MIECFNIAGSKHFSMNKTKINRNYIKIICDIQAINCACIIRIIFSCFNCEYCTIYCRNITSGNLCEDNKNTDSKRYTLHATIHCRFIYNSQDTKVIQVEIHTHNTKAHTCAHTRAQVYYLAIKNEIFSFATM